MQNILKLQKSFKDGKDGRENNILKRFWPEFYKYLETVGYDVFEIWLLIYST